MTSDIDAFPSFRRKPLYNVIWHTPPFLAIAFICSSVRLRGWSHKARQLLCEQTPWLEFTQLADHARAQPSQPLPTTRAYTHATFEESLSGPKSHRAASLLLEQPPQQPLPVIEEKPRDLVAICVLILYRRDPAVAELQNLRLRQPEQDGRMRDNDELRAVW